MSPLSPSFQAEYAEVCLEATAQPNNEDVLCTNDYFLKGKLNSEGYPEGPVVYRDPSLRLEGFLADGSFIGIREEGSCTVYGQWGLSGEVLEGAIRIECPNYQAMGTAIGGTFAPFPTVRMPAEALASQRVIQARRRHENVQKKRREEAASQEGGFIDSYAEARSHFKHPDIEVIDEREDPHDPARLKEALYESGAYLEDYHYHYNLDANPPRWEAWRIKEEDPESKPLSPWVINLETQREDCEGQFQATAEEIKQQGPGSCTAREQNSVQIDGGYYFSPDLYTGVQWLYEKTGKTPQEEHERTYRADLFVGGQPRGLLELSDCLKDGEAYVCIQGYLALRGELPLTGVGEVEIEFSGYVGGGWRIDTRYFWHPNDSKEKSILIQKGNFANGAPEGYAIYRQMYLSDSYTPGVRNSYEGNWRNGMAGGYGIHIWPDGRRIETETSEHPNLLHDGYGVYTWPDGKSYEGTWKEGQEDGPGVLTMPNGTQYQQEYKEGRLIHPEQLK